jgi:nicotinamidase-related amidase
MMTGKKTTAYTENSALIVIDMQEKLVPAMHEMHDLIIRTETLLRGCTLLNLPVIFTQQYTKGLGETIEPLKNAYVEAASSANENVKLAVEDQLMPHEHIVFSHVEKTDFSAASEPAFMDKLDKTGCRKVVICGVEAHICVLQTAEALRDLGYTVSVAADATASRRSDDADFAYSRMRRGGITVTTSEALLFGFLKSSKHPMFRQISELVK